MAFIVGTAGHIDHGKTSLVYALTGIHCDRLEEEKQRGITIELGFAKGVLPNGVAISFIDVPGHERFIKQMVSGVVGMHVVLLIISAEEGVMPQTKEHLDIIRLLGVKHCAVVITKIDLVDTIWLDLVKEQIEDVMKESIYRDVPILLFSSKTGEGKERILSYLEYIQSQAVYDSVDMPFRMPLDRVFTLKGHGTIVTGSVLSGTITEETKLMLYPREEVIKIKGLQSHNEDKQNLLTGSRVALNLVNMSVHALSRGEIIAQQNTLLPAMQWEVCIHVLSSSPIALQHMKEVHFHHHTKEVLARVYILNAKEIAPGEHAICILHFKEPMVGVAYDRAIIRSCSPLQTIAGVLVLNPLPKKKAFLHKKCTHVYYEHMLTIAKQSYLQKSLWKEEPIIKESILIRLSIVGEEGLSLQELSLLMNIPELELKSILDSAVQEHHIVMVGEKEKRYIAYDIYSYHKKKIAELLMSMLQDRLLCPQYPIAQLYSQYRPMLLPSCIDRIIMDIIKEGIVIRNNESLMLPQEDFVLTEMQRNLEAILIKIYSEARYTPPMLQELEHQYKITRKELLGLLYYLQDKDIITRITEDFWVKKEVAEHICDIVKGYFGKNEKLTLADFKVLTGGLSRKYILPLLEYCDRIKLTMRINDYRVLR